MKTIYKFRFVSVPLLAEYVAKDKSTIYEQLLTLVSQDYLIKNYDSSYRLPAKPATYCLASKGIKYLRETTDLSPTALRNQTKNRSASDELVEHTLKTFEVCNQLRRQYPGVFDVFTKSELTNVEDFIRPLPDLYLQRKRAKPGSPVGYCLELLQPSIPSWLLRKRIRAHCDVADEVEYDYPHVLFICTNESTENRLQRMLGNIFQDFEFWSTTTERLESSERNIWREVFEEDEDGVPIYKKL